MSRCVKELCLGKARQRKSSAALFQISSACKRGASHSEGLSCLAFSLHRWGSKTADHSPNTLRRTRQPLRRLRQQVLGLRVRRLPSEGFRAGLQFQPTVQWHNRKTRLSAFTAATDDGHGATFAAIVSAHLCGKAASKFCGKHDSATGVLVRRSGVWHASVILLWNRCRARAPVHGVLDVSADAE